MSDSAAAAAAAAAEINTAPDEPINIHKLRGYIGQDYSITRDSYDWVYVVDAEVEEYVALQHLVDFAAKYPKSIMPAFGQEQRVMSFNKDRHSFMGDRILLPRHVTAMLHYNVSNDKLDVLKDKSEREGVEWVGRIAGKDRNDLVRIDTSRGTPFNP